MAAMRSLLILGYVALAFSAGILAAFAAPAEGAPRFGFELASVNQLPVGEASRRVALRDVASASSVGRRDESGGQSLVEAAGTIIALAGAGIIGTLAAVGIRRVWIQNPTRDPYGESSGFF
jgi:hypothetical protein